MTLRLFINQNSNTLDKNSEQIECKIDKIIYELYGLSNDEIALIEKNN